MNFLLTTLSLLVFGATACTLHFKDGATNKVQKVRYLSGPGLVEPDVKTVEEYWAKCMKRDARNEQDPFYYNYKTLAQKADHIDVEMCDEEGNCMEEFFLELIELHAWALKSTKMDCPETSSWDSTDSNRTDEQYAIDEHYAINRNFNVIKGKIRTRLQTGDLVNEGPQLYTVKSVENRQEVYRKKKHDFDFMAKKSTEYVWPREVKYELEECIVETVIGKSRRKPKTILASSKHLSKVTADEVKLLRSERRLEFVDQEDKIDVNDDGTYDKAWREFKDEMAQYKQVVATLEVAEMVVQLRKGEMHGIAKEYYKRRAEIANQRGELEKISVETKRLKAFSVKLERALKEYQPKDEEQAEYDELIANLEKCLK